MLFFNNLIFTYISKEKPKQTEKKTYQLIRNSLTYLCMIIFGLRVFPKSELTNVMKSHEMNYMEFFFQSIIGIKLKLKKNP